MEGSLFRCLCVTEARDICPHCCVVLLDTATWEVKNTHNISIIFQTLKYWFESAMLPSSGVHVVQPPIFPHCFTIDRWTTEKGRYGLQLIERTAFWKNRHKSEQLNNWHKLHRILYTTFHILQKNIFKYNRQEAIWSVLVHKQMALITLLKISVSISS